MKVVINRSPKMLRMARVLCRGVTQRARLEDRVVQVRRMLREGRSDHDIAEQVGVSAGSVESFVRAYKLRHKVIRAGVNSTSPAMGGACVDSRPWDLLLKQGLAS